MALTVQDQRLLGAIQDGLPVVAAPFAAIADEIGMTEQDVIDRLSKMCDDGTISRMGVIVRHRELGYRANAMVVWDVPDDRVSGVGHRLAALPYVTLCYRRPRRPPTWPFNLFTMIHGRDRDAVESQVIEAATSSGISEAPRAVLFSRRGFKQRGARYAAAGEEQSEARS